jgi:hypothetical protein
MPLCSCNELSIVEEEYNKEKDHFETFQECNWLLALENITPELIKQCLHAYTPPVLSGKTFWSYKGFGIKVPKTSNFYLSYYVNDSGQDNCMGLSFKNSTRNIYCVDYVNENQTLRGALDSISITHSSCFDEVFNEGGYDYTWYVLPCSSPSLLFWVK